MCPMVVLRDQRYPVDGGILSFDFIRPDGEGLFPLVVFLHGGGWISGDKTMYREEAVWMASKGFACACIEYRLAPLYPFPVPVADCQAFVRFARQTSPALAVDPARIYAMGNSAGGHLALMLGMCPESFGDTIDGDCRVNAVVAVCPITDMSNPDLSADNLSLQFLEQFMDCPFTGNEARWRKASPSSYVNLAQGRYLLVHGDSDDIVPVSQSRDLASHLEACGHHVRYVELPGESHSFSYGAWMTIRETAFEFLNA